MITYVNTVLVGKGKGLLGSYTKNQDIEVAAPSKKNEASADYGKFIVKEIDDEKFRVGIVTKKNTESYVNGELVYSPIIKWSNDIKKADIKSSTFTAFEENTEDTITINFKDMNESVKAEFAEGGKRVILRLTFKDLPTRYRKWTESYEYVTRNGDTASDIAEGLADQIKKNFKRARVTVAVNYDDAVLTLTAMPYDDDDTVDSISPANKVRFSANMWYTDPQAAGFASKNKYGIIGATITKEPGKYYTADAKLVRDAEAQAMGYQGILNRGECTWPIIKPEMETELDAEYDSYTLEFENIYRTADDLHRKTKQTLQVFGYGDDVTDVQDAIETLLAA